jgi:hypothetical protein
MWKIVSRKCEATPREFPRSRKTPSCHAPTSPPSLRRRLTHPPLAAAKPTPNGTYAPQPILNHTVAVIEGTIAALVYPTTITTSPP